MITNVDLRQLAVRREVAPEPPRVAARRRHLVTRYLLPAAVLLGFLAVLGWATRDSLLPAREVTVVPVLATRAEVQQESGTPLFQAAGWIEPRPTPVLATALAEGVIQELLVVEGQEVKAGEPVARLVDADARLALKATEADVRLREAELASMHAALGAARVNVSQPVQLQAVLAEAEAMLAKTETDLTNVPFQVRAAEARLRLARRDFESKSRGHATGSVPEISYRQAESERDTATAAVEELKAREGRLKREVEALTRKRDVLRQRLELKTEETRQAAEAEAGVKAAEARLQQARIARESAQLRLERMVVRSPLSGRVLALIGRPGMRVMGLTPGSLHDASTVVSLYDPASLQVRADVRLEDVPRVQPGQPVRIVTPAAPGGPLEGEVLFATSLADIQKNTLQVKVAIKAPPPTLKPDMLVQATFLASSQPGKKPAGSEPLSFLVPRALVETGEGTSYVWVADQAAAVARRRSVRLGLSGGQDLVAVVDGLTAADKLIAGGRAGLRDGQRIKVIGEDASFGLSGQSKTPAPARLPRLTPGKAER